MFKFLLIINKASIINSKMNFILLKLASVLHKKSNVLYGNTIKKLKN